jgi:hypothetical protein
MQYGYVHAALQHIHPCHVDMDMQFRCELRHAASTCPCYITIPKLHVHVHAECLSLYRLHAVSPYPCCMSMSMLLFHVDTSCPCPCCISMSILHIHVNVPLSLSNITRILRLQKKAIRIITNANYNAHTSTLFFEQGILPFDKIITFSKLMFMHAIAYNYNITSFNNIWMTNQQRNLDMNLRNTNDFILPPIRRELLRKFPIYTLPWEWNHCGDVKLQRNRTTFKIQLTYDLFQSILQTN